MFNVFLFCSLFSSLLHHHHLVSAIANALQVRVQRRQTLTMNQIKQFICNCCSRVSWTLLFYSFFFHFRLSVGCMEFSGRRKCGVKLRQPMQCHAKLFSLSLSVCVCQRQNSILSNVQSNFSRFCCQRLSFDLMRMKHRLFVIRKTNSFANK